MNRIAPIAALAVSLFITGCSQQPAPAADQHDVGATSQAQTDSVVGTWRFVFESSDPYAKMHDRCSAQHGGDQAKSAACLAEIKVEADQEKIRFARDAGGNVMWTSFAARSGGAEELFLAVPVELRSADSRHVEATIAGAPTGPQTKSFPPGGAMKTMRVEIVDATHIAMLDPDKGRLVFKRE